MGYSNHRDLIVWKRAMDLARYTYQLTGYFPKEEKYNLANQMQRSAVSIPSNIAEGNGRDSNKELDYFLRVANGSAWELSTQTELAYSFGYIEKEHLKYVNELIDGISRMIYNLRKSIEFGNKPKSR
ncbi:MAG: four helix bundle protein [Bacteroidales bacterium]|nr:four helix bundle protein [Bacteroidales bacterium]